jgi:plasmid maintenance system antidote protein VapI
MLVEGIDNIEFDPATLETALIETQLSQAELVRMAGFKHRNTVNKILKSKREVTATDLIRFCAIFGKQPDFFAKK